MENVITLSPPPAWRAIAAGILGALLVTFVLLSNGCDDPDRTGLDHLGDPQSKRHFSAETEVCP